MPKNKMLTRLFLSLKMSLLVEVLLVSKEEAFKGMKSKIKFLRLSNEV